MAVLEDMETETRYIQTTQNDGEGLAVVSLITWGSAYRIADCRPEQVDDGGSIVLTLSELRCLRAILNAMPLGGRG